MRPNQEFDGLHMSDIVSKATVSTKDSSKTLSPVCSFSRGSAASENHIRTFVHDRKPILDPTRNKFLESMLRMDELPKFDEESHLQDRRKKPRVYSQYISCGQYTRRVLWHGI